MFKFRNKRHLRSFRSKDKPFRRDFQKKYTNRAHKVNSHTGMEEESYLEKFWNVVRLEEEE